MNNQDWRTKQYDDYINNAGKSNQPEVKIFDAEQGKRRSTDELELTGDDVQFIIFALIVVSLFMWWIL